MRISAKSAGGLAAGIGLLMIGASLTGAGIRQDSVDAVAGAIVSASEAFVCLPPEVIVASGTVSVHPAPDGSFVLIQRVVTPPVKSLFPETGAKRNEISLVLYNPLSRRTTILWREGIEAQGRFPAFFAISPVPQSSLALIQYAPPDAEAGEAAPAPMRLMVADGARAMMRNVATLTVEDTLLIAPNLPLMAIARGDHKTVQMLRPDGSLGRTVTLSEPGIRVINWLADGKTMFGVRPPASEKATEAEKKKSRWVSIDAQTGVVTSLEKRPPFPKEVVETPPSPLAIRPGTGALSEKETIAKVAPLWLEGAKPGVTGRTLLAPDGENPLLLPGAALYQRHSALFAVPILRMDRVAFAKLQQEAMRRKTMNNAKSIALGMLMYCQDYDENFAPPGTGQEIADRIDPYLKNSDVFLDLSTGKMGFQPLYKMTSLTGYENPATQLLGYLTGPGGRAAIYVDGHVKWEDNP